MAARLSAPREGEGVSGTRWAQSLAEGAGSGGHRPKSAEPWVSPGSPQDLARGAASVRETDRWASQRLPPMWTED